MEAWSEKRGRVSDEELTSELVTRGMRWRLAPDRYLKPGRSWTSRSRFRPLVDADDALRVLEAVADEYTLTSSRRRRYLVEACVAGRVVKTAGTHPARTICLAAAQILGIETRHADEPKVGIAG